MNSISVEIKKQTVVEDPKLSLKQFSRYPDSTQVGKVSILTRCKYPGGYIPRFYEEARKILVNTFSSNYFGDYELYFSEFQRHADRLKKEAVPFNSKTDDYKNRHCSGVALEKIIAMQKLLVPILDKYVLNSNLGHNRDNVYIKDVRIGAMSDVLLFDNLGNHVGLLKFNFTNTKLKKNEAQLSLHLLRSFFINIKQLTLSPKHCIFVDVFSAKIYYAERTAGIVEIAEASCLEIRSQWPSISNPKEN